MRHLELILKNGSKRPRNDFKQRNSARDVLGPEPRRAHAQVSSNNVQNASMSVESCLQHAAGESQPKVPQHMPLWRACAQPAPDADIQQLDARFHGEPARVSCRNVPRRVFPLEFIFFIQNLIFGVVYYYHIYQTYYQTIKKNASKHISCTFYSILFSTFILSFCFYFLEKRDEQKDWRFLSWKYPRSQSPLWRCLV